MTEVLKRSLKHGWSYDAQPHVYEYDETASDEFGFARLWSGGMSTVLQSREGIVHVAVIVEGSAEVMVDGSNVQIETGQIILLDGDCELHAHSPKPWARYGWFFRNSILRGREYRPLLGEPRSITRESLLAMTSVANTSLDANRAGVKPSIHTRIAMEHLAAAAAYDHSARLRTDPVHRDGLFLAAQSLISERFRDPALTVEVLSRDLAVSASSLHRAYQPMGTSPRREIERHRVAESLRRLALDVGTGAPPMVDIAAESGFTSVVTMRRSLTRAGHRSPRGY
ncbi:helix-turn-helix domain-containing protein [Microbacterium saperdae]|uniref:Helix-turn-helix protein n=1 Tax=Microbacterium saperdae TaxID=69368 RepID=A0A543BK51_9MICO|nr:helix-turn-helix domain-containing protein [Microbacterium saperdae]TQL85215.1 helix-turn-helix protein [Microbacterium saperdae]